MGVLETTLFYRMAKPIDHNLMPARHSRVSRRERPGTWMVLDVRDYDFAGGHIRGCLNRPASEFERDADVDAFIERELKPDVQTVVVHCALSQVRGPYCANR